MPFNPPDLRLRVQDGCRYPKYQNCEYRAESRGVNYERLLICQVSRVDWATSCPMYNAPVCPQGFSGCEHVQAHTSTTRGAIWLCAHPGRDFLRTKTGGCPIGRELPAYEKPKAIGTDGRYCLASDASLGRRSCPHLNEELNLAAGIAIAWCRLPAGVYCDRVEKFNENELLAVIGALMKRLGYGSIVFTRSQASLGQVNKFPRVSGSMKGATQVTFSIRDFTGPVVDLSTGFIGSLPALDEVIRNGATPVPARIDQRGRPLPAHLQPDGVVCPFEIATCPYSRLVPSTPSWRQCLIGLDQAACKRVADASGIVRQDPIKKRHAKENKEKRQSTTERRKLRL